MGNGQPSKEGSIMISFAVWEDPSHLAAIWKTDWTQGRIEAQRPVERVLCVDVHAQSLPRLGPFKTASPHWEGSLSLCWRAMLCCKWLAVHSFSKSQKTNSPVSAKQKCLHADPIFFTLCCAPLFLWYLLFCLVSSLAFRMELEKTPSWIKLSKAKRIFFGVCHRPLLWANASSTLTGSKNRLPCHLQLKEKDPVLA